MRVAAVVDAYEPYPPTESIYTWASLSFLPLESGGQAAYMEIHPTTFAPQKELNQTSGGLRRMYVYFIFHSYHKTQNLMI